MADAKPKFEDSLRKLEALVAEMESGSLPLDDMIARFEEGRRLVAACNVELESIRQRIEQVVAGKNGEPPKVEPLEILKDSPQ